MAMVRSAVCCAHYVERKKRRCKMTTLKNSTYCAGHASLYTEELLDRVPCPLDPAHFISAAKLQQHVKVCNALKFDYTSEPYFKANVNLPPPHAIQDLRREPLSKLSIQQLIGTCLKLLEYGVESKVCKTETTETVTDLEQYRPLFQIGTNAGNSAVRHATQQVALLNALSNFQVHNGADTKFPDTCFVELGAGSGKLSQWFHYKANHCFFLLVDKQTCRRKADSYFRKQKCNFIRLKMDIKDIDVSGVPGLGGYKRVCFACKHLCGGATDLALVAAAHSGHHTETTVLIALCCHHLCSWESYSGKDYFITHFKPEQFYTLSSLSAWATCFKLETLQVDKVDKVDKGDNQKVLNELIESFQKHPESNIIQEHLVLDRTLQWHIGRCAKNALNDGRAQFMLNSGFRVQFSKYVNIDISPENTALLCFKDVAS